MDRIYKMMKRNNKGFTLVELMVVLLIIGILVAIAIPIYNNAQDNAQKKACQANLRTIDGAIAQYNAVENDWPANLAALSGYLKSTPTCPTDGSAYTLVGSGVNLHAECTHKDDKGHKY
jgi:type II secretion system protein G